MEFLSWLTEKKGISLKGAKDIESRLRRVKKLLTIEKINANTLVEIEKNEEFLSLSRSVKSQLRRSIYLYSEFKSEERKKISI